MKRIAIIGGGICGISAAYELARQQQSGAPVEFMLFEATDRLGGIVETKHIDDFIIECGPDSWVSEKPWARELAIELGLEAELIFSRDEHRRTYLAEGGMLQPIPGGMRMMIPVEWAGVLSSPLFSQQAKLAYLREPQIAGQLKATALDEFAVRDESVRDFVVRHFGAEVADTIAAPLLAGVFGGDIAALSARAVLPAYVELERQHGSLILALQQRNPVGASALPIFTSLRRGLSSLIEAMESHISRENIRRRCSVEAIEQGNGYWRIREASANCDRPRQFDAVLIATPAKTTARLLRPLNQHMAELLPEHLSSAIVVAFAFSAEQARSFHIPEGFGFLVPQRSRTEVNSRDRGDIEATARRALLACTFVDQKFPYRAPPDAVLLRVFFGGEAAPVLLHEDDASLGRVALASLEHMLGRLPEPAITVIRRWPDSLPLYMVGHLNRIAELDACAAKFPSIRLIGNAYRGVGLPDLIRQGRSAAREMIEKLTSAEDFGDGELV